MPIRFRCAQCGRLLQTSDETAGKQARCPECGALTTVPQPPTGVPQDTLPYRVPPPAGHGEAAPSGGVSSPFGPGTAPAGGVYSGTPYQAPGQYVQPPEQFYWAAHSRMVGPAIGLILTAAAGVILRVAGIAISVLKVGVGAGGRPGMMPAMIPGGAAIALDSFALILAIVVLIGALKMKSLENYALAMAVSIIAMIPCLGPCCLLGIPFGIWSLVVLLDPQVKAAFRS
jgi:phage FluMu protein Com